MFLQRYEGVGWWSELHPSPNRSEYWYVPAEIGGGGLVVCAEWCLGKEVCHDDEGRTYSTILLWRGSNPLSQCTVTQQQCNARQRNVMHYKAIY